MSIMVVKGWFKGKTSSDIEAEMCSWADKLQYDYMPAEWGSVTPLVFIEPSGKFKVINDNHKDIEKLCTIKGINQYFNDRYGYQKVKEALEELRQIVGKPVSKEQTDRIWELGELIRYGKLAFEGVPIDVREDEFNEWSITGWGRYVRDSITNVGESYGEATGDDYSNDNLYLLVVECYCD